MKKLILTLALICSISQISALPDMRKFEHDAVDREWGKSYDSKEFIDMYFYRKKTISYFEGLCKVTGYTILISLCDDPVDSICVLNKGESIERSTETTCFNSEILTNSAVYSFDGNTRIIFVSDGKQINKCLIQTFDTNQ